MTNLLTQQNSLWYKDAVIYQLHVRAFKDSNGDGIGDLNGVRESLNHIRWLGANCLYLSPVYDGPNFDWGYDVSDYYAVKQRAIACHATQFGQLSSEAAETRVTPTRFRQLIESRDLHFGAQIGVAYAEGLVVRHPVVAPHLMDGLTR